MPTTTNADDANTSGARIGNDAACAVSALLADSPMIAKIHVSEKPKSSITAMPASSPKKPVCDAEADEIPDGHHQHHDEHVAHEVGERAAREHRRARHRQRAEALDEALVQILGEPDPGLDRTERDGLREHAGHQVVDVGRRPGS